jgi:hypothetical protein
MWLAASFGGIFLNLNHDAYEELSPVLACSHFLILFSETIAPHGDAFRTDFFGDQASVCDCFGNR